MEASFQQILSVRLCPNALRLLDYWVKILKISHIFLTHVDLKEYISIHFCLFVFANKIKSEECHVEAFYTVQPDQFELWKIKLFIYLFVFPSQRQLITEAPRTFCIPASRLCLAKLSLMRTSSHPSSELADFSAWKPEQSVWTLVSYLK